METKRNIGIDLHRNCFTACVRLENGREYLKQWRLEELDKFAAKLRPTDQVAVEVTGNTRLFHEAVAPQVERVVAVNPRQFQVIRQSVKKTDPNDARNLALYLAKDLLPEVRMKDKDSQPDADPRSLRRYHPHPAPPPRHRAEELDRKGNTPCGAVDLSGPSACCL